LVDLLQVRLQLRGEVGCRAVACHDECPLDSSLFPLLPESANTNTWRDARTGSANTGLASGPEQNFDKISEKDRKITPFGI
ncbi:MAG: hypothetical protein K0S39_5570, partial [Paenibacillus sp.]|nr:hypothetical protein [Paenibacillus sp.]